MDGGLRGPCGWPRLKRCVLLGCEMIFLGRMREGLEPWKGPVRVIQGSKEALRGRGNTEEKVLGMVVHISSPDTWEVKAGGFRVQGYPQLHREVTLV